MSALAAGRLSMDEYEPGVRLAILPDKRDELPAAPKSAILYKVDLLGTF